MILIYIDIQICFQCIPAISFKLPEFAVEEHKMIGDMGICGA